MKNDGCRNEAYANTVFQLKEESM